MYTWPLIILVKAWILGGGGAPGCYLDLVAAVQNSIYSICNYDFVVSGW